jgi:hypothetical protein
MRTRVGRAIQDPRLIAANAAGHLVFIGYRRSRFTMASYFGPLT